MSSPIVFSNLSRVFKDASQSTLAGVPDGLEALVLSYFVGEGGHRAVTFVARDGQRAQEVETALAFFAPWARVIQLPAWDCLPYDRVSPTPQISARRITALAELAGGLDETRPTVIICTPNAILQRVPPREVLRSQVQRARPGGKFPMEVLIKWLEANGFQRTSTVRDTGEYAVRGGILDLFPPGDEAPIRLDYFGDTLESIRSFDAETQRTIENLHQLNLVPMSEVVLNSPAISRFRSAYLGLFGGATRNDALYEAVSEGRRYAGIEHWLPLFFEELETCFDYLKGIPIVLDHLARDAMRERQSQIEDHYSARLRGMNTSVESSSDGNTPYKPVPVENLYLLQEELDQRLAEFDCADLSPFENPPGEHLHSVSLRGRQGRSFAAERAKGDINIFDALIGHINELHIADKQVIIASWSEGARERLSQVLTEHGLSNSKKIETWGEVESLKSGQTGLAILGIETGFETPGFVIIGEQDVLGDRLIRKKGRGRKGADFLSEVSTLAEGDIVVHVDHGIARFAGLKTIEAAGSPHDCVELHYHGDDKLYLPVENIELLSRYGSSDTNVILDKLGGVAWQSRKAKLKKRILEMAGQLIAIAAARALKTAEPLEPPAGLYDEFAARFPYEETEDQLTSIESVLDDLASGRPMDRLVCGDVGFGKTEVALRAAFVTAMAGKQVALVVPTTLLARQHFKSFQERFHGLPVNVAHASRLVGTKALAEAKKGAADGTIDILIGTHALLGKSITFKRLGLLIIDEEQHFGVKHKERLKELRSDVHVLTLTATPIPRTLQLALTGVRELSLITTAPVDRLAVRTFISPFDSLVVREAFLRERYRGGQSFLCMPKSVRSGRTKSMA